MYRDGTYCNGQIAGKVALQMGAGCVSAAMNEGSCGRGAASAGTSALFTGMTTGHIASLLAQGALTVAIGGGASVIGGGKFSDGATVALAGYLFNCVASKCYGLTNPEGGRLAFYGTPDGSHFGRASTISALIQIDNVWGQSGEASPIEVGNISLEKKGHPDHASHEDGQDVDIRPIRTSGSGPLTWRSANYDRAATQRLVDVIRAVSPNATIYFNDPDIRGETRYPNHDNHLHVRFK
jgi:hypothetical protein